MTTSELKQKLITIYNNYVEAYDKISDQDYKAHLMNLGAGSITPPKYKFFSTDYRDKFAEMAIKYRDEALAIIDDALDRIRIKKTEAPTTEAVNYLAMLKDKADISEHDIEDALSTYGDNYSAYNAIRSLADSNEIRGVGISDLDVLETEIRDNIIPVFNRFGVIDAENGHATQAVVSMFEGIILGSLPELVF